DRTAQAHARLERSGDTAAAIAGRRGRGRGRRSALSEPANSRQATRKYDGANETMDGSQRIRGIATTERLKVAPHMRFRRPPALGAGHAAIAFLALVALAQVLFLAVRCDWDLSGDEAEYWAWSRKLDWSYFTRGPLIALVIRAGT